MKTILRPSQFVNYGWMFITTLCVVVAISFEAYWLCAVGVILIWKMLQITCWQYIFVEDSDVLIEKKGVFSVTQIEVNYFRIKSVRVMRPFFLRIFGLAHIEVITSEPFKTHLRLYAIENADEWAKFLKESAIYWRDQKGVKEVDFHSF